MHIDDPDYFDRVFNQTNGRAGAYLRGAEAFGPYPAVYLPLSTGSSNVYENIIDGARLLVLNRMTYTIWAVVP